jgi:hypothetical protein
MRGRLFFLLKQCLERVGVGTELTKILGWGTFSQFMLTTAFLATKDTNALKVSHDGGIGLCQGLRIDRKREQHFLQSVRCTRPFCSQAAKVADSYAQILCNPHYIFLTAFPQLISHSMHVTIFVDPSGNGVQYEFNHWIMLLADIMAGHGKLHWDD